MIRSLIQRPLLPGMLVLLVSAVPLRAEEMAGVRTLTALVITTCSTARVATGRNGEGNELADVPRMLNFVGNFLKVDGGREFVVQVPGSANTALPDDALAELLNWMLPTMSRGQMPSEFTPYRTQEVSILRRSPESDVIGRRAALIRAMQERGISAN